MRLGERLTAARRDAQIRGAEAFMADELDDAHLLAEHRAEMVRVLNDEGGPVWWCVGGPHDGRPHDNNSCNCGGLIVPVYRPATEVRHV